MEQIRWITHEDGHEDEETLINGVWAVTRCDCTLETKRATAEDIQRIWRQLWGDETVLYLLGQFEQEDGELLDRTQYNYNLRAAGTDQDWTHNPSVEVSASETPATSEVKHAVDVQMVGEQADGKEQSADSASSIQRADALPDEGQQEPAASATEPSEVN